MGLSHIFLRKAKRQRNYYITLKSLKRHIKIIRLKYIKFIKLSWKEPPFVIYRMNTIHMSSLAKYATAKKRQFDILSYSKYDDSRYWHQFFLFDFCFIIIIIIIINTPIPLNYSNKYSINNDRIIQHPIYFEFPATEE